MSRFTPGMNDVEITQTIAQQKVFKESALKSVRVALDQAFDGQFKLLKEDRLQLAQDYEGKKHKLEEKHAKMTQEQNEKNFKCVKVAESSAKEILDKANEEKRLWELEKAKIATTRSCDQSRIKLDVGGTKFTTSKTTLTRFPDSVLGAMFSGRHAVEVDEEGYFFVDRDGTHFRHILNFLRDPDDFTEKQLTQAERDEFRRECAYYGLCPEQEWILTDGCDRKREILLARNMINLSWKISGLPVFYCSTCKFIFNSNCQKAVTNDAKVPQEFRDSITEATVNNQVSPNSPLADYCNCLYGTPRRVFALP